MDKSAGLVEENEIGWTTGLVQCWACAGRRLEGVRNLVGWTGLDSWSNTDQRALGP